MLLVCSDIQVLESPLMSVEVTKMQDLIGLCEFSQNFRWWYPRPPQREGATPSRGDPLPHPSTAQPVAGRGAPCAPVLEPKRWSPSTLQPWLRPCYMQQVFPWAHQSHERKRYLDRFQIFCRAHLGDWPTDRLTDHATCSITIIKERNGNKAYLYSAICIS